MGKTLDVLLGRSFKPSKFKALVNLAISRLAILKNQKQARRSLANTDVIELLNLGQHERALIRVEQVIKEQNMLDVFALIEGYCVLLTERIKLIEHEKDCPNEVKEAISSLIFAATRCGEFPELQEIRRVFTSRYGKEFSQRATELRNNCGVNSKIIQKLSTRQPSLESRMKVLKEIADGNGFVLQLEDAPSMAAEEKLNEGKENWPEPEPEQNQSAILDGANFEENLKRFPVEMGKVEEFANSVNRRKQYKNAVDAAQEAFLSAAYAAAAARAAVELSRSNPQPPDNHNNSARKQVLNSTYEISSGGDASAEKSSGQTEDLVSRLDKVHPIDKYSFDPKDYEEGAENEEAETIHIKKLGTGSYTSTMSPEVIGKGKQSPKEVRFDVNDNDNEMKREKIDSISDKVQWGEKGSELPYYSHEQTPSNFKAGSREDSKLESSAGFAVKTTPRLNIDKRLISVRNRR